MGISVVVMNVTEKRGKGRPKRRWMDSVKDDLGQRIVGLPGSD